MPGCLYEDAEAHLAARRQLEIPFHSWSFLFTGECFILSATKSKQGASPGRGMTFTIAIVLAMFAVAGGFWGWRVGTRNIQLPPERYDFPGGMTRSEFLRRLKVRHQRRRIFLVLGSLSPPVLRVWWR